MFWILLTIRRFLDLFPRDIQGQNLGNAVGLLNKKVKELDCDKAIKLTVCKCIGVLLKKYRLNAPDVTFQLDALSQKLKIEVEKIYIVDTLCNFGKDQTVNKDVIRSI